VTGWLYIKSPSAFRRQLDVDAPQKPPSVISDALNATAALMILELTVGVRDIGVPPMSTVRRLTLMVDLTVASPDVQPVLIPSLSSSYDLTWIQRLFIVVGSALGAALLATVVFVVVVRHSVAVG